MLEENQINQLIALRRCLHKTPELSENESKTSQQIISFLKKFAPSSIDTQLGGYGIAANWQGKESGNTILLRAELDALPIQEANDLEYKSTINGVSHKCGHDGHMAILCGIAMLLHKYPLKKGKVVLLFQPAEETGVGARKILEDPDWETNKVDYAFALHNLPKQKSGVILCKKGTFCAASTGLKIRLTGKTAHASQPETGLNPAIATAQFIYSLNKVLESNEYTDKTRIALTHTQIGEKSFGVSAGEAEVWLTLRAHERHDFDLLLKKVKEEATAIAQKHELGVHFSYHEHFEATENNVDAVEMVREAALKAQLEYGEMEAPNPWSEDFGLFLNEYKGAMFGLGSGLETPDLHNPDYDFPDKLIEKGVHVFWNIIQGLNS